MIKDLDNSEITIDEIINNIKNLKTSLNNFKNMLRDKGLELTNNKLNGRLEKLEKLLLSILMQML